MGNLLLVNYIKVYIDKEIISIELISSSFTHKVLVDIMNLYLQTLFVYRSFLVIICSGVNYYYGEGNDNDR